MEVAHGRRIPRPDRIERAGNEHCHARAAWPRSHFGYGFGERLSVETPNEKDAGDGRAGDEGWRSGAFDRVDLSAGDVFGHGRIEGVGPRRGQLRRHLHQPHPRVERDADPGGERTARCRRETGVRVHHSHNEAVGRENWPKIDRALVMEEEAERQGVRVSFDMFPYTAVATMMIAIYPPWALEGGVDLLIERLKDRKTRRRIERDIVRKRPSWPPWSEGGWPHNLVGATGWDSIFVGYVESRRNNRYENRSLAELAQMTGERPFDAISDLIIEERGQVSMLIFEISGERDERDLLSKYARHRLSAFCTDAEDYGRGLPHPAAYGAFARILSKYVREDRALTLEEAVRKMTSYPARIFGLKGRGVIRPGAFADLTVFDPGRVNDRASFEKPRREAVGVEMVIINGCVAFENGQASGNLPGSALRNSV